MNNLTVRYVLKLDHGIKYTIQITHYFIDFNMKHLEFILKLKNAPKKDNLPSCLDGKGSTYIFHGPTKLRHCVGLYVKIPKFTWLPLGCLLLHQSLFYIFDCGLFYVNQGIRPYADICGVCAYLCTCTVYADANVLRRSQTVIEPCTENESFFYIILSGLCVCLCVRGRERYMYIWLMSRCADVQ